MTKLRAGVAGMALAGSIAMLAGSAAADGMDKPSMKDQQHEHFSWRGPYIGASIGYSRGSTSVKPATTDPAFTVTPAGPSLGIYGGYNVQLSGVVFGVEADIAGLSIDGSSTGPVGAGVSKTSVGADWGGRVRGRIGVPLNRTLLFAAGGWSTMRSQLGVQSINSPGITSSVSARLNGWNVGAGAEYAVTNHIVMRLEYIYDRYAGHDYGSSNAALFGRSTDKLSMNTVRLGAAVKW